ncbi:MAG: DUF1700 domain-containing protein [Lachnospiraceae bacterium]|nr:DUF1700 domain-containing protein [Lachnospiraceae bacterium]
MTKHEYIEKLREYLSYELPERLVKKNTDYYSEYFDEQLKLGKDAEEICDELGDPQLIARSCIDVEKAGEDGIPLSGDEPDFQEEIYGNSSGSESQTRYGGNDDPEEKSRKSFSINGREIGCGGCLLIILIVAGVMGLASVFFSTLFAASGSSVIAVILLVILASVVAEYFRRR